MKRNKSSKKYVLLAAEKINHDLFVWRSQGGVKYTYTERTKKPRKKKKNTQQRRRNKRAEDKKASNNNNKRKRSIMCSLFVSRVVVVVWLSFRLTHMI